MGHFPKGKSSPVDKPFSTLGSVALRGQTVSYDRVKRVVAKQTFFWLENLMQKALLRVLKVLQAKKNARIHLTPSSLSF